MMPTVPVVSLEENDPASLVHSQLIQAMLVDLLTNHPEWCPRWDDFIRRNANDLCIARQSESISPELFTRQLIELTGNQHLEESARIQHVAVWRTARQSRQPIGGTPGEWLGVLTGFIEICFPRTPEEWLDLADQAYTKTETREYIKLITALVIQSMGYSDHAGFVAFDIKALERNSPTQAFAVSMTSLTRYLALTQLAWPTRNEVDDFANLNQLTAANESQHTTLAIMQLFHKSYSGLREQRGSRENPFAFLVRKKLDSPLNSSLLHPEIDSDGALVALRQVDGGHLRSLPARNLEASDSSCFNEIGKARLKPVAKSKARTATVTNRDRKEVGAAIEAYKLKHNGEEPTVTTLRINLRGKNVGQQKLTAILNELRATGEFSAPGRPRKRSS